MPANSNVTRSRHLLITGGYALLGAAFLAVGVIPYFRGVSVANAAIAGNEREIQQRLQTKEALARVNKEITDLDFQVRNYSRLVPPNQDLGDFLEQLSRELTKAGMTEVDVHAQSAITLGKSQKLPITLHASGTYPQFQSFLLSVEKLDRMCSVGQIILSADPAMSGRVNANLTLFIYNSRPN